MIFRRLPASSSFVLAAVRLRALQLDPSGAGGKARAPARKIPKNSQAQPGDTTQSHRVNLLRPLDTKGPYGWVPNSGCCVSVYVCIALHIVNSGGDSLYSLGRRIGARILPADSGAPAGHFGAAVELHAERRIMSDSAWHLARVT